MIFDDGVMSTDVQELKVATKAVALDAGGDEIGRSDDDDTVAFLPHFAHHQFMVRGSCMHEKNVV